MGHPSCNGTKQLPLTPLGKFCVSLQGDCTCVLPSVSMTGTKKPRFVVYLSTLFFSFFFFFYFICYRPSLKFTHNSFNPLYSTYGLEIVPFTIDDLYKGYSHLKEYTLDTCVIVPPPQVKLQCCSVATSVQCSARGGSEWLSELLNRLKCPEKNSMVGWRRLYKQEWTPQCRHVHVILVRWRRRRLQCVLLALA